MNHKELYRLYTTEYTTNPRTGKPKKAARYIGKRWSLDKAEKKRMLICLWSGFALGSVGFVGCGFVYTQVVHCLYVMPFYLFTLLALFYLGQGCVSLSGGGLVMDEIRQLDGRRRTERSALAMMILGGGQSLGCLVWLILNGFEGGCLIWLLGGLVTAASGWLAKYGTGLLHPVLMEEEKEEQREAD